MRRWCEEELVEQLLEQEANLFRFTSLTYHATPPCKHTSPPSLDPYELLLTPLWYKPYEQEPTMLLWQP
jgi:hypothetical protein